MPRDRTIIILLHVALVCFLLVSLFGTFPNVAYAAKFNIGDTVEVTTNLNVRTGPSTSNPEITDPDYPGYAPAGTQGKVLDGPTSADGYVWWKVDYGPGLYSGWSVEGGLTRVSEPPASAPVHVSPSNGATDVSLTPTLQWQAVSGATKYGLYVSKPPYGEANLVYENESVTGISLTLPSGRLSEGVTYRWNMRAGNDAGCGPFSSSWSFTTKVTVTAPTQAPSHVSPSNGATDVSLTPTLQWQAVSGATKYGLYVSKPPYGEANLVYENESVTGTSLTLPSGRLSEGVTYRWNMRAGNDAGWSSFSSSWSFTTLITPAPQEPPDTPPSHISPSNGATGVSLMPTFSWSAVSGADRYALYVSKPPYGEANLVYENESVTGISLTLPSGRLSEGVTYRWNMRAGNDAGCGPFSSSWSFTTKVTVTAPTQAPSHVSPSNGATDVSLTPTLQWQAVSGATKYGLYVSKPPYGEANLVYENESVTGISLTLPSGRLSEGVTYRWNMRAGNDAGWSSFSSSWSFTTEAASLLPPPSLSSPSNGATGVSTTPTFSWSSVSGANKYWLMVATSQSALPTDPNATSAPGCVIAIYTTSTSYTPSTALNNSTTYYWQVQAFNDSVSPIRQGQYSSQRSFTTPDTTPPRVDSLSVTRASVALGGSFTISYSVSDTGGSGLKQVELWRANDSGGSPVGWAEVKRISISGNSYSGSFSDAPSTAGTYWYGIHVIDNAGNWAPEDSPIKREVVPPTTKYSLTISETPSGGGTVSQSPQPDPDGKYVSGTQVTVTATPASGWSFDHWGGDASGTNTSITITMNSDKSITAYFSQLPPTRYTLTINISGQGSTSPSQGSHTYDEGTQVTLTASPALGYTFDHWGGNASGTNSSVTITMDSDKSVIAYFTEVLPVIGASPTALSFEAIQGGLNPPSKTLSIWNAGGGSLDWGVSSDIAWLAISQSSGSSTGETDKIAVSVDITGMDAGDYSSTITISAKGATNLSRIVPVSLSISPQPVASALSDLTVTLVDAPSEGIVGQNISVTFVVENRGNDASGPFHSMVALSPKSKPWGTEMYLGDITMDSIPPDDPKRVTVNVTVPPSVSSPSNYYVTVFVDAFEKVLESNEGNNIGSTYPQTIAVTSETSTIADLITSIATGGIPVTVDGELYFILTLENHIDPLTLEVVPGSGTTKVYVDAQNYPVSDKKIVSKIGFIDFARQKASNLQQDIDELAKVQILLTETFYEDMAWALFNSGVTAVSDIKDVKKMGDAVANIEKIKNAVTMKDIAKLKDRPTGFIVNGIILLMKKTIGDPMDEIRDDAQKHLFRAWDSYNSALRVLTHNQGDITSYTVAREFLGHYLYGEAGADVALSLSNKIFGNFGVVGRTACELFWTAAGWFTADLTDFVDLALKAKQVIDWTWDATDQWLTASSNAQNKLWPHKLHEAAPYTLELANSPRITWQVQSPVEVRAYDSQGRVTGIVNGEVGIEIPYSVYHENVVTIFSPTDSYDYELVGTGEGSYELTVTRIIGQEVNKFTTAKVPTSLGATHLLTVDWDALSRERDKLPIRVDSDGDGRFEGIVHLSGPGAKGLPPGVWLVIGVVIGFAIAFGVWRHMGRKQVAKR